MLGWFISERLGLPNAKVFYSHGVTINGRIIVRVFRRKRRQRELRSLPWSGRGGAETTQDGETPVLGRLEKAARSTDGSVHFSDVEPLQPRRAAWAGHTVLPVPGSCRRRP